MMMRCGGIGFAAALLCFPALAQTPSAGPASGIGGEVAPKPKRRAIASVRYVLPPSRPAALAPATSVVAPPAQPLAFAAAASPPSFVRLGGFAVPAAPAALVAPAPEVGTIAGSRSRGRHRDMVARAQTHPEIDALIATHARANNIPEAMVHRIVVRESRYNPRAVGRGGAMGLMQIKHATARGMGYQGSPAGLLDADTNLRYAVPYLAGAYRTANGNPDRTVSYYASGYYYAAKSRGIAAARPSVLTPADTDGLTQAQRAAAARPSLFSIFAGTAKPVDPNQAATRRD